MFTTSGYWSGFLFNGNRDNLCYGDKELADFFELYEKGNVRASQKRDEKMSSDRSNVIRTLRKIEARVAEAESILSAHPEMTWNSPGPDPREHDFSPMVPSGAERRRDELRTRERRSIVIHFNALVQEAYSASASFMQVYRREGIEVGNAHLERLSEKYFPNPSPRQMVEYLRAIIGELLAKSAFLED